MREYDLPHIPRIESCTVLMYSCEKLRNSLLYAFQTFLYGSIKVDYCQKSTQNIPQFIVRIREYAHDSIQKSSWYFLVYKKLDLMVPAVTRPLLLSASQWSGAMTTLERSRP